MAKSTDSVLSAPGAAAAAGTLKGSMDADVAAMARAGVSAILDQYRVKFQCAGVIRRQFLAEAKKKDSKWSMLHFTVESCGEEMRVSFTDPIRAKDLQEGECVRFAGRVERSRGFTNFNVEQFWPVNPDDFASDPAGLLRAMQWHFTASGLLTANRVVVRKGNDGSEYTQHVCELQCSGETLKLTFDDPADADGLTVGEVLAVQGDIRTRGERINFHVREAHEVKGGKGKA